MPRAKIHDLDIALLIQSRDEAQKRHTIYEEETRLARLNLSRVKIEWYEIAKAMLLECSEKSEPKHREVTELLSTVVSLPAEIVRVKREYETAKGKLSEWRARSTAKQRKVARLTSTVVS